MLRVEAKVRFVSLEPLLGHVYMPQIPPYDQPRDLPDWVIVGALTSPDGHQPDRDWVPRGRFGVPIFYKDNLECEGLRLERRREFPEGGG